MERQTQKRSYWQPFIYGALIALGIMLGIFINPGNKRFISLSAGGKISEIEMLVENSYVDTVNEKALEESAIEGILNSLDPHSVYIPAEDLVMASEPLEGNFQGIGIEFSIIEDTIYVVSAINGGPAEKAGVKAGDRFVMINGENFSGRELTNEKVVKTLKGKEGTKVRVGIYRKGVPKLIDVSITRGTIPLHSANIYYMIRPGTGYLKITRFAENTLDEFRASMNDLRNNGMTRLVLDLRGNPGGYLDPAIQIADEFLDDKKLIVYTEGRHKKRQNRYAEREGDFEQGNLAVLMDEGSASASEVLAGALQDWDRATIVGRRSFGKGLVQEPFNLSDGSAMRLTVARYYTPTGRSIQKPYEKGHSETYNEDILNRYRAGEFQHQDSIKQKGEKFVTPGGKIVYGGGGIMPDIFVPLDTGNRSAFVTEVLSRNILNDFVNSYLDTQRDRIKAYGSPLAFSNDTKNDLKLYEQFLNMSKGRGTVKMPDETPQSRKVLIRLIKANIAHRVWGMTGYNLLLNQDDPAVLKALDALK